ncbi:DUF2177 family protein [Rhodoferax sp. U11-2br]|uniref:DUF2177 family protein n=1 Tax=Rhodoferax sp. U11-2br TaxID=2838878 RepID=UPI0020371B5F|nr:DUF2177 family protein [Rhodoferax sp. U11-2br]
MINKYLAGFAAAAVVMVALDMFWLGVMYQEAIGRLIAGKPNIGAALAFYLVYPMGLMVFVLAPPLSMSHFGVTRCSWGRCSVSALTQPMTSATSPRSITGR